MGTTRLDDRPAPGWLRRGNPYNLIAGKPFRFDRGPALRPVHSGTVLIVGERVMIGIGAIVKSFARVLEVAGSAAVLGLRLALGDRRPKPCPIPVLDDARRRRR